MDSDLTVDSVDPLRSGHKVDSDLTVDSVDSRDSVDDRTVNDVDSLRSGLDTITSLCSRIDPRGDTVDSDRTVDGVEPLCSGVRHY